MGYEKRCLAGQIEFKTRESETGDMYINGYFSVFNSEYEMWQGATESIDSNAFNETLSGDIRCLINHDTTLVLGRTKNKTLQLSVDNRGLWGEVKINPKDTDAVNLYERVKRGDVDQCSFGFEILEEEFEDRGTSVHWTIKKVKLYEVSIVTFPAYEETSVSARQKEVENLKKRDFEVWKTKFLNSRKEKNNA